MPYDMAKKAAPCAESIPWEAGAYVAAEDFHGSDIAHRIGAYYMQEPSAMLPVAALSWDKSWRVLDLCASPGGKTRQRACRLSDGFLVSNEHFALARPNAAFQCRTHGHLPRRGHERRAEDACGRSRRCVRRGAL